MSNLHILRILLNNLIIISPKIHNFAFNSAFTSNPLLKSDLLIFTNLTFVIYGNQTGILNGLYAGGGSQTLVFAPDNSFKIGEVLEVILSASLTSTDGASLDPPIVYHFWAKAQGGTGVFNPGETIAGQLGARGLADGDWDDDGDLDHAVANSTGGNNVRILINQ